jgi:hypothetical protein
MPSIRSVFFIAAAAFAALTSAAPTTPIENGAGNAVAPIDPAKAAAPAQATPSAPAITASHTPPILPHAVHASSALTQSLMPSSGLRLILMFSSILAVSNLCR